ncbi:hypothetical protein PV05_02594 [Exophiala xenobiotica]|uniref:Uncharacterized protein n=1 Tax=Exophiala xenobiotica TaxID=348802 RepID=A0A0D2FDD1_9EURO|nr:uncharacterized protein PV05_02594 [Exophiala xenobiotica]KIW58044.1 hypothetical protein PV05_02594 [Exophiala xenobiotica]
MLAPSARRPPLLSLPLRVTISNFVGPRRNGHIANYVTYNGLLVIAAVAQAITPKNFDTEARSYDLVYTSDKNAYTLLKNGTPMIPILIPKDLATYAPHLLQLNNYLDYLSTKLNIDVHTYERAAEGDNDVLPEPIIGSKAIELFRADSEMPLNFLNLHYFKANPQP